MGTQGVRCLCPAAKSRRPLCPPRMLQAQCGVHCASATPGDPALPASCQKGVCTEQPLPCAGSSYEGGWSPGSWGLSVVSGCPEQTPSLGHSPTPPLLRGPCVLKARLLGHRCHLLTVSSHSRRAFCKGTCLIHKGPIFRT